MMKKEYRNMKVYEQSGYRYKSTPAIMLKGQWLRNLGFEENTPIVVHCEGGKLTIIRSDEVEASFTEISAEPVMCVAEAGARMGGKCVWREIKYRTYPFQICFRLKEQQSWRHIVMQV